ncbi:MAG: hypothetical protein JST63_07575 [Bacteroidetes bacterium]|nr:hypothetical protein [Bacteroidota bacterium]
MQVRLGLLFIVLMIAVSCGKDKFGDKPTLKFKEMSGDYLPSGGNYAVQVKLEYTDAQGDIAGVPLFIQKLSSSYPCADNTKDPTYLDSLKYTLPAQVPPSNNQKGEIIITLSDDYLLVNRIQCGPLDTLEDATFRFWFRDQAGNMSDTVTTPVIKVVKP